VGRLVRGQPVSIRITSFEENNMSELVSSLSGPYDPEVIRQAQIANLQKSTDANNALAVQAYQGAIDNYKRNVVAGHPPASLPVPDRKGVVMQTADGGIWQGFSDERVAPQWNPAHEYIPPSDVVVALGGEIPPPLPGDPVGTRLRGYDAGGHVDNTPNGYVATDPATGAKYVKVIKPGIFGGMVWAYYRPQV
jgi:hypothetical protein